MPNYTQLTLWEPEALVVCPECGAVHDVYHQLKTRGNVMRHRLKAHPAVTNLPEAAGLFFDAVLGVLLEVDKVELQRLADTAGLSKQGAYRQANVLVARGVLAKVPKRVGGRYSLYQLAISPPHRNGYKVGTKIDNTCVTL